MDGNKDESLRCISIAERYLAEKDVSKALKFFHKSNKLYPSDYAQEMIDKLDSPQGKSNGDSEDYSHANGHEGGSTTGSNKSNNREENLKQRHKANSNNDSNSNSSNGGPGKSSSSSTSSSSPRSSEYTQEQLEAIRKIKRCKNYYELLGVSKESTDAELKKQYRKLALQFHPDKNKTPGASEAFKAISNAFVVLSDPEKKRQYDLYGSEEPTVTRSSQRSRTTVFTDDGYFEYHRGFDSDVSAEELFNMFFGGGNVYVRRSGRSNASRTQSQSPQHEPSGFGVLIQMLPILFLVCLSMMSSFFVADPAYSMQRTAKYPHERVTNTFKVPYYVKDNFESEYKSNIRRVETLVEEEYINNLRAACYREKSHRDAMLWRARTYGDKELEEKAKKYSLHSCTKFNEIQGQFRYY